MCGLHSPLSAPLVSTNKRNLGEKYQQCQIPSHPKVTDSWPWDFLNDLQIER